MDCFSWWEGGLYFRQTIQHGDPGFGMRDTTGERILHTATWISESDIHMTERVRPDQHVVIDGSLDRGDVKPARHVRAPFCAKVSGLQPPPVRGLGIHRPS